MALSFKTHLSPAFTDFPTHPDDGRHPEKLIFDFVPF